MINIISICSKGYVELGYQTLAEGAEATPGIIFTGQSYSETFEKDVLAADRELVISAPILARSRIATVLNKLPTGTKLRIITRSVEAYTVEQQTRILSALKLLEDTGAEIIKLPKLTQRYAVIDGAIVWYGDVNFMSSAKSEDTVIRLESPELAGELLDMENAQE